ncbi:MAG: hypothetical protein MRK01_03340 [Candidatus Scalindua sp.]|nr:hypothetical protein [Candidatus Scalindua sp.]
MRHANALVAAIPGLKRSIIDGGHNDWSWLFIHKSKGSYYEIKDKERWKIE